MVYSHSQLSYISALGHQREQIQDQDILKLLDQSEILLNQTLIERQALPEKHIEEMFSEIDRLNSIAQVSEQQQLLLKQITLLLETLPELVMLKNKLLEAYNLKDKNYKVAVKKIKSIENEVLSIGFPVSVFEKLKDEFVFDFFEWYAVYNTNIFFDKELYIDWHNKVVKESFKTSKTETEFYIVEQLKKYPLANKTPMEVFMWVANLQKMISN